MSAVVDAIEDLVDDVVEALEDLLEEVWDSILEPLLEPIFALFGIEDETVVIVEHLSSAVYETNTKDVVKVYLSAQSRDIVKKQKLDLDESLKNLQKYLSDIGDREIAEIVTILQSRIIRAQAILSNLIRFYSSENLKYKQSIGNRYD